MKTKGDNLESTEAVAAFLDLLKALAQYRPTGEDGAFFRGQSDATWPLLPKVGRPPYNIDRRTNRVSVSWQASSGTLIVIPDQKKQPVSMAAVGLLGEWAKRACSYLDRLPDTLMELMALAQHHGLATPLLDWTMNPLVAIYFAANQNPLSEGAVYVFQPSGEIHADATGDSFGSLKGVGSYRPRAISPRILNQSGVFTFHAEPTIPVTQDSIAAENETIRKWIRPGIKTPYSSLRAFPIMARWKKSFLSLLDTFGINEQILFPGLDGLSRQVNWWKTELQLSNCMSDEQFQIIMRKFGPTTMPTNASSVWDSRVTPVADAPDAPQEPVR